MYSISVVDDKRHKCVDKEFKNIESMKKWFEKYKKKVNIHDHGISAYIHITNNSQAKIFEPYIKKKDYLEKFYKSDDKYKEIILRVTLDGVTILDCFEFDSIYESFDYARNGIKESDFVWYEYEQIYAYIGKNPNVWCLKDCMFNDINLLMPILFDEISGIDLRVLTEDEVNAVGAYKIKELINAGTEEKRKAIEDDIFDNYPWLYFSSMYVSKDEGKLRKLKRKVLQITLYPSINSIKEIIRKVKRTVI